MASLMPEQVVYDWDGLANDLEQERKRKINRQAQRRFRAKTKNNVAQAPDASVEDRRPRQIPAVQEGSAMSPLYILEDPQSRTGASIPDASLPDDGRISSTADSARTANSCGDQHHTWSATAAASSCSGSLQPLDHQNGGLVQHHTLPSRQDLSLLQEQWQPSEPNPMMWMHELNVDGCWLHAFPAHEPTHSSLANSTNEEERLETIPMPDLSPSRSSNTDVDSTATQRHDVVTSTVLRGHSQRHIAVLHTAASNGQAGIVQMLIAAGADIEPLDASGATPLHLAAKNGHEEAVHALLRGGSNPDAIDYQSYTPLHLAVVGGHDAIVRLLISYGVDISISAVDNVNTNECF